jgi:hypothetical protein
VESANAAMIKRRANQSRDLSAGRGLAAVRSNDTGHAPQIARSPQATISNIPLENHPRFPAVQRRARRSQ